MFRRRKSIISFVLILLLFPYFSFAQNEEIYSFSRAKKELEKIYFSLENRETLYCEAFFDTKKNVILPTGFVVEKHVNRANKIEWEHVVPAENFGRNFIEWTQGSPICKNSKGKSYKGRACAEKANENFRYMQADMYNLYPAIGAVNASRSNYSFALLPEEEVDFGTCNMKIENKMVEPPIKSRGKIARAYLYMEETYAEFTMPYAQKELMLMWSKEHPVTEEECKIAKEIEQIQGNTNFVVENLCNSRTQEQMQVQYHSPSSENIVAN